MRQVLRRKLKSNALSTFQPTYLPRQNDCYTYGFINGLISGALIACLVFWLCLYLEQ
jgi:hypothetical protein